MTTATQPLAYLIRTFNGYALRVSVHPHNSLAFLGEPVRAIKDARAARAYCKAHGYKPYNF